MKIKLLLILSVLFISCAAEDTEVQLDAVVDGKYKTNVLMEDYTATWCQWCPRVAKKIEDLSSSNAKRITPIAIHVNSDVFMFNKYQEMQTKFSVSGYPFVELHRAGKWNEQAVKVTDLIAIDSNVGLALESSLKDRTLSLTAKVGFGADLSDLKLSVYLTENGLKANQKTQGDLGYGEGTKIGSSYYLVDFVHDHVLRASISELFGDAIDTSKSKNGEIYEKTYEYVIPDGYSLKSNIVAFVSNKDDKVLNSRYFVTTGEGASNGKFQTVD